MTRRIILVATVLLVASAFAATATARNPILRTVERLSMQRESAIEEHAAPGKFHLARVQCAATRKPYMYLCAFIGTLRSTGAHLCGATYIHYNPHLNAARVNIWGETWSCESPPPYAPPSYPGDGPAS